MPGFNGTGPSGEGPMTGGGRGYCGASDGIPGQGFSRVRSGSGLQIGRGRRNGRRGMGMMRNAQKQGWMRFGPNNHLEFLKNRATILKDTLSAINNRIRDLEPEIKSDTISEKR